MNILKKILKWSSLAFGGFLMHLSFIRVSENNTYNVLLFVGGIAYVLYVIINEVIIAELNDKIDELRYMIISKNNDNNNQKQNQKNKNKKK